MPAAVRLGDTSTGDPCGAPARPNNMGCAISIINNKPIHCATHTWVKHACPGDPPHDANTTAGSPDSFAESLPIARIGDPISCGSTCATGSPDTFVN
jgi:hypothetical protein